MSFGNKTYKYRNFMRLGFRLSIVISKGLLVFFSEDNIETLKRQLHQIFNAHQEFIEDGMSMIIKVLPKKIFSHGAQIRHWKKPQLKKCHLNITAEKYAENPSKFYIILVHELTHWHDREMTYRWHKSHLVSSREEVNLLSMILHSLRIDGLANLRMFYAKASERDLFDKSPHKITEIANDVEVNLDFESYVTNFKEKLINFKGILLKSKHPSDLIVRWVTAQYNNFYFLGGMMCYLILFAHMLRNGQETHIQIFLDENQRNRIEIQRIRDYLHRRTLYFGKVPLPYFEYTFNVIKGLKPAAFFILYLESCSILGLDERMFLIFDKPEADIIVNHRHEIDRIID